MKKKKKRRGAFSQIPRIVRRNNRKGCGSGSYLSPRRIFRSSTRSVPSQLPGKQQTSEVLKAEEITDFFCSWRARAVEEVQSCGESAGPWAWSLLQTCGSPLDGPKRDFKFQTTHIKLQPSDPPGHLWHLLWSSSTRSGVKTRVFFFFDSSWRVKRSKNELWTRSSDQAEMPYSFIDWLIYWSVLTCWFPAHERGEGLQPRAVPCR